MEIKDMIECSADNMQKFQQFLQRTTRS